MELEASFGVIPLRCKGGHWEVLIIQHGNVGHWGFPKGRPEGGETPHESAKRELTEETGLRVIRFLSDEFFEDKYQMSRKGKTFSKTSTYYPAEVEGEVVLQIEELGASKWVPLSEATKHLTYAGARSMIKRVIEILQES